MSWYMTEERQMLQKVMREFVRDEVKPFVKKMEEEEEYPREIMKKLGDMGILGLTAPVEYGGQGVDWVSFGIALEEISRESNTLGLLTALNSDWLPAAMAVDCSPEQLEEYIKPALRGEKILAGYCTEECGIFNFPEYTTTAVPDPDGDGWVINGTKILGTSNGVCDAIFVLTKTAEVDPATMYGMTIFMFPADTPGVKFGRNENKLGWHGSNTGTLYLDNVHVTKENLVGEFNKGAYSGYFNDQTNGLSDYGAIQLGSAERVWEDTRKFLSERIQGGVSLWDAHQHIRIAMTEMWIKIENYRYAVYSALEDRNNGEIVKNRACALKAAGVDLVESVASQCIVLHGGMGTVVETGVERFYRDAVMGAVGCGSIMTLKDQISMGL